MWGWCKLPGAFNIDGVYPPSALSKGNLWTVYWKGKTERLSCKMEAGPER